MRQDESFPKGERIIKKREFEKLFRIGKRRRGKNLTLIWQPSDERRIGFVVERHIKGSVVRNKLKRRLRDTYRKNKSSFDGECIIVAYPGAENMSYSELCKEILRLTKKLRLNLPNGRENTKPTLMVSAKK